MKKYLLLLFLLILPIVFAQETSFNFLQNQDSDVKIICKLNGDYCPAGTTCKLTAYYPNSSVFINNQLMAYNAAYFNYSISGTLLSTMGIYRASARCEYNSIFYNLASFYFGVVRKDVIVNDNGNISEGRILTILGIIAPLFLLLWLIFYLKGKPIHYLFLFLGIIDIDSLIYFSYLIAESTNSTYSGVLLKTFIGCLTLTFILIVVMMIDITIKLKNYAESVRKNKERQMWDELPISDK